MHTQKLAALVGLGVALALSPAETNAAEHIYHGTDCQPSPSDNVDADIAYTSSGAYNIDSTYSRPVYCPITRANVANTTGLNTSYIRVYDGSTTTGFSCTIYSMSQTGSVLDSGTNITSGSYTGSTSIGITGVNTGQAYGSYFAYCSIPKNYSRIHSYRIVEP